MRRRRCRRRGAPGHVRRRLEGRRSIRGHGRRPGVDVGDRDPPPDRDSSQTPPRPGDRRRVRGRPDGRRRGPRVVGHRARRPGGGAQVAVAGAACRGAGDRARRPDVAGSREPARDPDGNGEDPHDAGANRTERGIGMTWHVDTEAARHYANRRLDSTAAASVESHLLACDVCRAKVGNEVDDGVLSFVWSEITDALDRPRLGWAERLLRRLGCSDTTSRIVVATTAARWSYAVAVAMSVAMAIMASRSGDDRSFEAFLMLAPIGPLVATAGAYGRWIDPAHALLSTTPTSTLRIVLIRTVASVGAGGRPHRARRCRSCWTAAGWRWPGCCRPWR